jgi:hypothetical protein
MLSARLDRLRPEPTASRSLARGVRIAVVAASLALVAVPLAAYGIILGILP